MVRPLRVACFHLVVRRSQLLHPTAIAYINHYAPSKPLRNPSIIAAQFADSSLIYPLLLP
ncbi:hypothetical protein [Nostoc sp. C052]|uniref:hypothetical protein n=1 Tax=Nostoc sp. C052 TaxID=2576902 RepID=UPI0015C31EB7|nr:hypothetical protein [Nostoc sp. C052]